MTYTIPVLDKHLEMRFQKKSFVDSQHPKPELIMTKLFVFSHRNLY